MPSGAFRRTAIIAASIGLTGVLAYWYFALRTPPIPHRTLRIGYENVPPVQLKTDKGPSGLAIETVNEAARRAGISLQWVETGVSSEESLRRGLVDLWPLMADLPDRRKRVHISRPFLYTSHNLILRPGSVRPDSSTFTGRVGVFKLPLHLRLAQTEFPNAQVIQLPEMRQVVQSVCTGAIDVGFLEDRAALAELRDRPPECGSMALRVESLHEMRLPLGVGSTFECAGAADKLRSEIGELYRDGTLAATMAKYSYYGLDDTWSTYALMEASEHARWMAWGAGILGIILAVTVWQAASLRQRKRSEAALRTSEERFRAIFNQAAVGDAQVALDGQVTMVNDRYCRVLGYSREELIGKHLAERIHPEDCAGVLANRRRLLEGASTSYSAEIRSVRKNGEIAWIKLHESLVRHEEGGPPQCSIAVVEDITERRQTELALQESEKRFRNMADTAPVMIWVADADQRCTFFSQGWLNFTGATMEQAVGNGWTERLHPDSREPCQRNFSGAFATHSSFQTECRLRRADGEYRWVLATGTPRFASHGAFAGYVGSCTDITDVKNAQEEALARQKWEGLGVLAGGIAHDFNNLLGSILATSELVLSELPPGSAAGAGVVSIKNVADRAAEIVRQMMAYSGQEDTVLEPLDLSALVKDMLQLLSVSISKRAQLTIDLPENLPAVLANAAQIRQVVMNLITNASEALGDKEGVISVGLAHVPVSQSRAADKPEVSDKDHVRLTISDTGSGMTEQIRARIFDPFFTTKFAGRGLGLAAVRGIIRDHKGAINVFSLPGLGSRFEVLLPCTQHPVPLRNGRLADVSANRIENAGETVLVVEDEQDLRLAVSKMLRKRGFSVIEASDGHAGVDLFRANSGTVDVVLLDLTLPGRTGREVLEEMRRIRPDVNVIVTTAYSQETALQTIGGKQSWRYLRKPYRIVEVENLLRRDYRQ